MQITLKNGYSINPIATGVKAHTINDVKSNILDKADACLLYVEEAGDITVTTMDGDKVTLSNYDNYPALMVRKVWATGTAIDSSKIKLFQ